MKMNANLIETLTDVPFVSVTAGVAFVIATPYFS